MVALIIVQAYRNWLNKLFKIFDKNFQNRLSFHWTLISAISLTFSSRIVINFISHIMEQTMSLEYAILFSFVIICSLCLFLILEKLSENIISTDIKIEESKAALQKSFILMEIVLYFSYAIQLFDLFKGKGKWIYLSVIVLALIGFISCISSIIPYSYAIGYSLLIVDMVMIVLGTCLFMKIRKLDFPESKIQINH